MAKKKKAADPDEVLGYIDPRPARRIAAVGAIGVLGVILLYIAATHPPANLAWLVFLIVLGLGCIYGAWHMWVVTAVRLVMTRTELREVDGRVLFSLDEVASIDRGFFAFKPANGFLVRLKTRNARPRIYVPGLWWRAGKTIMVGGVVSRRHTRAVADLITILLLERDNNMPGGLEGRLDD